MKTTIFLRLSTELRRVAVRQTPDVARNRTGYSVKLGDGSVRNTIKTGRNKCAALLSLSGLYALCLSTVLAQSRFAIETPRTERFPLNRDSVSGAATFAVTSTADTVQEDHPDESTLPATVREANRAGSAPCPCAGLPCAPPPSGLISWWPTSLNAKDIIGDHDGTLDDGVTYVPGRVGYAFSFNGTGAVNIPNPGNLNVMTGDFSVDAWVRFTRTLNAGETAVIFQNYGGVPAYTLAINGNNRVYFSFRDDAGKSVTATGSTLMNDGAWHFVAGVRAGAIGYIYVDGIVEGSGTDEPPVGPINITCQTAHIGGTNTGAGHCTSGEAVESFFTGEIDEVEIFHGALTPGDIRAIWEAGCRGKCSLGVTKLVNVSTRARLGTGDQILIGGFIITGDAPKNVVIRGIGPSLTAFDIKDVLADPTLELRDSNGALLLTNNDWRDSQDAEITATGLAPSHNLESAMVVTLPACASYTAILAGRNGGTGVGLVEIYDIDDAADSELANISTRGFVQTGDDVMIGGFILRGNGNSTRVAARGIGPSLPSVLNPLLANPTLELHGTTQISNDDWQRDPTTEKELTLRALELPNPSESGIFTSLPPGAFTVILAGQNSTTGSGLVEIYNVH